MTRLDAVVQVGRPGAGDRREHLDGLVLGDEDAELPGDARHRGEAAADEHAEALLPLVDRADERDAVDLGGVVAIGRGRDRVLVLAREVREVGVAVEELRRLLDDLRAVEQLERVDPLHGRARDVADGVAAAAGGRDARGVELGEDVGQALQGQVVQLDVLACRELADTTAEAIRDLADRAQLRGLDEARRQLHAQHERADLGLVVVEPPPLEADDVLLGHRLVAGRDQRRQLVADGERGLVALDALDGIALEDEVPIGLGSLSFWTHGRAHGHLHDGMRLPPLRDTAYARCRWPPGRDSCVLAETTNALALFQARVFSLARTALTRPGDRRPSGARMRLRVRALVRNSLLSTLDILRATWLAGIGTLPSGQVAEVSSGRNPQPLLMWSGTLRVRSGAYTASTAVHTRSEVHRVARPVRAVS